MDGVITLTTDFGAGDAYVAAMKGVILGINPMVTLVDICHNIEPQNIAQAAFVLSTAYPYFPPGPIHLVVVDPGVGSQRRAILLKTPSAYFVAPDNGALSYIIEAGWAQGAGREAGGVSSQARERELGPGFEAIALTNPRFWCATVSATFHGRDIFAPVAAHLSAGVSIHEFGEFIPRLLAFPPPRPQVAADGTIEGHVLHIDSFGNLITDVRAEDLPPGELSIEVKRRRIAGLSPTYAQGGELLALLGSSGNLEVAARNKSAAKLLAAKTGDSVTIRGNP